MALELLNLLYIMKAAPHQAILNLLILLFFLSGSPASMALSLRSIQSPIPAVAASDVTAPDEASREPDYLRSQTQDDELLDPQLHIQPSPSFSEEERLSRVRAEEILSDPLSRIDDAFAISPTFRKRVEFWFGIYTRYGANTHVIHHSRYPWIVYDVVNLDERIQADHGPKWLRIQRAENFLKQRRFDIRLALRRLSRNPRMAKTELEKSLRDTLVEVAGPRRRVYALAASSVRSQLGQRDFFMSGLRRSSRYLPALEETFVSYGLPKELTRMPFVESSFNISARSKVGASGIWQIMPPTGRAYGRVTPQIDERNSPLKATAMAARLLKSYRHALKEWPLAVTSYNHGIGNIQTAIRAARSRNLEKIIARYHQGDFKFASSNFYACFLAALHAERYSELVFPSVVRDPAIEFAPIRIDRAISVNKLLTRTGLSREQLLDLNLDIDPRQLRRTILPRGFILHIPAADVDSIVLQLDGVASAVVPAPRVSENRNPVDPNSI